MSLLSGYRYLANVSQMVFTRVLIVAFISSVVFPLRIYPQQNAKGDKSLPSSTEQLTQIAALENGQYKYSVEDFFVRPRLSMFQISPDGKYFSYGEKDEKGKNNIYTRDIQSGIVKKIIEEKGELIRGYFWVSGTRLVYYMDKGGDENYKLYAIDVDGSNEICLTPYDGVSAEVLIKPRKVNPAEMIVQMNKDDPESTEPYLINIYTGLIKRLFINKNYQGNINNYYFDERNNVNAYISIEDGTKRVLYYKPSSNEGFKKVLEASSTDKFELTGFVQNTTYPHDVYMISNIESNTLEIVIFDLMKGKTIKKLFSNQEYDLEGMYYSVNRNEVDYYYYNADRWKIIPVSKKFTTIYKKIASKLKGYDFTIYGRTHNDDKILLDVYSSKVYHKYYVYHVLDDSLQLLVNLLPNLKEEDMAESRPITFKTRDGLTLHGYFYIPNGTSVGKKVPLLVNPHGGPFEVRNDWSFNREAQLFASRGYATLQINFRGSGGYGKNFYKAGLKQVGRKMLDDLEDGLQYVKSLGLIDSSKVAIYGGSHGGFAALSSLLKSPQLYTCAVDICGISNIFTFFNSFPPQMKKLLEKVYLEWYDPRNPGEQKIIKEISPALNADKISKPVLIAHGANDPRVKIEEADQLVKSLRNRGIDVPYMVKYNEGHGFAREGNRMELYKVMLGFFARYLKTN